MSTVARHCLAVWVVGTQAWGPHGKDHGGNWGSWGDGDGDGGYGDGGYGDGDGSGGLGGGGFGGMNALDLGNGLTIESASHFRTIHGILAAVAFVGLFPLGSIVLRLTPGRFAWIIHALIQMTAWALYIAAAAIGLFLVRSIRIPPEGTSLLESSRMNAHPIIGIVVLAFIILQPVLGIVHHSKFKKLQRRTWWSHAHLFVGRAAVTLGIINGGLGLALAGSPRGAVVAYSVVAGIMWLLWLLAAVFGEWRRARAQRKTTEKEAALNSSAAAAAGGGGAGARGATPSPPYTPGPLYGGPGLNNTPRGPGAFGPPGAHKGGSPARTVSSASSSRPSRRG